VPEGRAAGGRGPVRHGGSRLFPGARIVYRVPDFAPVPGDGEPARTRRSRPDGHPAPASTPNAETRLRLKAIAVSLVVLSVITAVIGCGAKPEQGMARGKQLFQTCVPCHGKEGHGNQTLGAPAIAGQEQWYLEAQLTKFRSGVRGAHPEDDEGNRMRPMARTLWHEVDIASVAEYVSKMPEVKPAATVAGGNPEAGKARYAVCTACHGPQAAGLKPLFAPALANQADWYMMKQLGKFKSGMRGAHPEDIHGQQMRAMALTLPDEQAMKDVVAYIRTLSGN